MVSPGLGRQPVRRRQCIQVVVIGHPRQAREDVLEVGQWILAMAFARDDERVEDRGALAGIGMAGWPMKSQFFLPMQDGRIAFSTRLLSKRLCS